MAPLICWSFSRPAKDSGHYHAVAAEIGNVADVIPHAAGDIDDELHIHRL